MSPIEAALAEIESLDLGEYFLYSKIAQRFRINRSTLSRRHRAITQAHTTKAMNQQKLSPQQERELARYIETLTERRISPTQERIRNFASTVAKEPVSEC
jgi:hypothetical protein